MPLGYNNDDGAQALDQQQEIDFRRGWQVVDADSGSNVVTAGTGSYDVDVAAGDINTPTGTVTCSAATLDLESLVDPDLPRIVIVYRDDSGVAQTLAGTPAAKQPEGETAPGPIYQPAPDAFSTTDGVVLATVLLEAAASSVGGAQIRDRRMPASLNVDSAEVGSLNTEDASLGQANNSPLLGSRFYGQLSGESYNKPSGGQYESAWYSTEGSMTINVTGGNEITGNFALEGEHSGSGNPESVIYYPFMDQSQQTQEHFVAANHVVDFSFRYISGSVIDHHWRQNDNSGDQLISLFVDPALKFYDGDKSGGGTKVNTGISASSGDPIHIRMTVDYDNYEYDVEYDVAGSTGTMTGLGFQYSRDFYNSVRLSSADSTAGTTFAWDHWHTDKPVWMVFGDSITSGTGYGNLASDGSDSFRYQLNKRTGSDSHIWLGNTDGGGSTGILNWANEVVGEYSDLHRPSRMLIAFGAHAVNDPSYSKESYVNQYLQLVGQARSLGIEPFGWLMTRRTDVSQSKQEEWVNALQTELDRYGIPYVNAWDETTNSDGTQKTSLFADSTHPNASGHDAITDRIISDLSLGQ